MKNYVKLIQYPISTVFLPKAVRVFSHLLSVSTEQRWKEAQLELKGLAPTPQEEWQRSLAFVGLGAADKAAMSRSVEALMRSGAELVANTYEHLQKFPETATILGWEDGLDPQHLEERRRFFTVWLARTLGMDTSDEFAAYLFSAGKYHAGHGPRHIHTPPTYVTASMGMVVASFAQDLTKADLSSQEIAAALAGWSKYLSVQLNLMLFGYHVAREFETGNLPIPIKVFGTLRPILGKTQVIVCVNPQDTVSRALSKFFNYYPEARPHALERLWDTEEKNQSEWLEVVPIYILRKGWRILLNGRELIYQGGFEQPIGEQDEISIFPPGR